MGYSVALAATFWAMTMIQPITTVEMKIGTASSAGTMPNKIKAVDSAHPIRGPSSMALMEELRTSKNRMFVDGLSPVLPEAQPGGAVQRAGKRSAAARKTAETPMVLA